MRKIYSLNELKNLSGEFVVALGNFDGLHLGHQELLKQAKKEALGKNLALIVFTFNPHPQIALGNKLLLIDSPEQKERKLEQLGVGILVVFPFTKDFSSMLPEDFVRIILKEYLKAKHIFVGFNYSFGNKGRGNTEDLEKFAKKYAIDTTVMKPFLLEDQVVSSSRIRRKLEDGAIEEANLLLGNLFSVKGKVVCGNKLGRKIGFPTANMMWQEELLVPKNGVYSVKVLIKDKIYNGVANVGYKPTVTSNKIKTLEVNILDFSGNIYGEFIEVYFLFFLRDEKKFNNIEELKEQISLDVLKTRELL